MMRRARLAWGVVAIGVGCAALVFAAQAPELPDDDGRAAVVDMCSNCHGLAKSVEKRHTESEWRAIVADMRDKGAPGGDDDAAAVVKYLAKHFGPK